jgi:hypothetical protein
MSVADELQISEEERSRLHTIVYGSDERLFLIDPLDALYDGGTDSTDQEQIEAAFGGNSFTIPVKYVTSSATIRVEIEGYDEIIEDWQISKVTRKDKKDLDSFYATYKSSAAKKYEFEGDEKVTVTVIPDQDHDLKPYVFKFEASRNKAAGFLDNWDWLDDASSWSDKIAFERVTE